MWEPGWGSLLQPSQRGEGSKGTIPRSLSLDGGSLQEKGECKEHLIYFLSPGKLNIV